MWSLCLWAASPLFVLSTATIFVLTACCFLQPTCKNLFCTRHCSQEGLRSSKEAYQKTQKGCRCFYKTIQSTRGTGEKVHIYQQIGEQPWKSTQNPSMAPHHLQPDFPQHAPSYLFFRMTPSSPSCMLHSSNTAVCTYALRLPFCMSLLMHSSWNAIAPPDMFKSYPSCKTLIAVPFT